jgi:hypothetical protein
VELSQRPSPPLPRKQTHFFRSLGPVLAQQSRQGAIGEQLSSCLAIRTVVGFVGRATYALDLCLTARARLFVSSMHGHSRSKRRNFLGKIIARFPPQALCPLEQTGADRRKQPLDLIWL